MGRGLGIFGGIVEGIAAGDVMLIFPVPLCSFAGRGLKPGSSPVWGLVPGGWFCDGRGTSYGLD